MTQTSRRRFLRSAAAAGAAPFILPSKVWADPPSKKLAHAAIGITGQASGDISSLVGSNRLEVVAIAEVDKRNHAEAKKRFPNAVIYQDWRELFAKESDKFESVNVTVPDHMHAIIAMNAINRKKHVYCQKPLTHTVHEAHALRTAAKKAGVVTQMGNQIQSDGSYRTAVKMIKDGVVGKIKEVHSWCSAQFPQAPRPATSDPVPEGLDWNLWLGVAPERPYHSGIYHPFNWRGWQDFGGGAVADFTCHIMDNPYKALDLAAPFSVECTGAEQAWIDNAARRNDSWPQWETFRFEFAGTDFTAGKTLPLYWYDGGKVPPSEAIPGLEGRKVTGSGSAFIGESGTLMISHFGTPPQLLPLAKQTEYRSKKIPSEKGSPQDHYTSFVLACLGEGKTTSHFDYAVPLVEAAHLGMIAVRFPGKKLAWDSAALKFPGNDDATAFVKTKYRDGWSVEGI
ncbi:MAG TPA: Gfo/Idh/MocA family oxidoreductase [Verrucomicrobiales bacterium]|nr:Gfo/Idh/MocA family oxidoreductase [Verrucomicrobiales bacterium]